MSPFASSYAAFREPGSTDTEDLHSGSRAAIAGGITAVFEMPNTNPPTSNIKEFQRKLDLAKDRMYCNYAFYFGATAGNVSQLAELKNLEGCCGIKLFVGSSTGNLLVALEEDIDKVFQNSSKVVAVHSEDEAILKVNKKSSLKSAIDLGIAMQLTNISRDVIEDSKINRFYINKNFEEITSTIDLADTFYKNSFYSIKDIPISFRFSILVARRIYRKIGYNILNKKTFENYKNSGKIVTMRSSKFHC